MVLSDQLNTSCNEEISLVESTNITTNDTLYCASEEEHSAVVKEVMVVNDNEHASELNKLLNYFNIDVDSASNLVTLLNGFGISMDVFIDWWRQQRRNIGLP